LNRKFGRAFCSLKLHMTVAGFGVQLLHGETYHLMERVRLSPPWTCHYSHLMKNPAVSLNYRLTYHQPKTKMEKIFRR
jgi:hypothetical protein